MTQGQGLNFRFSTMVRHRGRLAVLITTKGDESPGSSRMGVIGALVNFFPSEAAQDKLHSP